MIECESQMFIGIIKPKLEDLEIRKDSLSKFQYDSIKTQILFDACLKLKKQRNCKQIKKSHKRNYYGNI